MNHHRRVATTLAWCVGCIAPLVSDSVSASLEFDGRVIPCKLCAVPVNSITASTFVTKISEADRAALERYVRNKPSASEQLAQTIQAARANIISTRRYKAAAKHTITGLQAYTAYGAASGVGLVPSVLTALALQGVKTGVDVYYDYLAEKSKQAMNEQAIAFFASRRFNADELRRSLQNDSAEEIIEKARTQSGLSKELTEEIIIDAGTAGVKRLAEIAIANTSELREIVAEKADENDRRWKEAKKSIDDVQKAVSTLNKETNERFSNLQSAQTNAMTLLQQVAASAASSAQDIKFLKTLAIANLTDEQRLSAIENGWIYKKGSAQAKKAIDILRSRIKVKNISKELTSYLTDASSLAQLANELKILPVQDVANLQKNIYGAQVLVDAGEALASGRYLAATSILINGFGGGVSPATARHAEILSAFSQVFRNQHQMLENQKLIAHAVRDVHGLVIKSHNAIMERLDLIVEQNDLNLDFLKRLESHDLIACRTFRESLAEYVPTNLRGLTVSSMLRVPYESRRKHFTDKYTQYSRCIHALERDLKPDNLQNLSKEAVPPILRMVASDGSKSLTYVKQRVQPLYDFLVLFPDSIPALLKNAVSGPSGSTPSLYSKSIKNSAEADGADFGDKSKRKHHQSRSFVEDAFQLSRQADPGIANKTWLHPRMVELYANEAVNLYVYYGLLESASELMTVDKLRKLRVPQNNSGEVLLVSALSWLDTAIAQQTLFAGDSVLPHLNQYYVAHSYRKQQKEKDQAREARREAAAMLVAGNPHIEMNLARFRVYESVIRFACNALEKTGCEKNKSAFRAWRGAVSYSLAISEYLNGRKHLLRSLLDKSIMLKFSEEDAAAKGGSVQIMMSLTGKRWFPIPSLEELVDEELIPTPEAVRLSSIRSRVEDELIGYELPRLLSSNPNQQDFFLTGILGVSISLERSGAQATE